MKTEIAVDYIKRSNPIVGRGKERDLMSGDLEFFIGAPVSRCNVSCAGEGNLNSVQSCWRMKQHAHGCAFAEERVVTDHGNICHDRGTQQRREHRLLQRKLPLHPGVMPKSSPRRLNRFFRSPAQRSSVS